MGDHGSILQAIINCLYQPFVFVNSFFNSIMSHEIQDLGLVIKTVTFENLYYIRDIILSYIHNLDTTSPQLVEALRFLKVALIVYLNILYLCYILRLVLYWFPNINPYIPPLYALVVITQPPLTLINKIIPILFGIDLSFIIVTIAIQLCMKGLLALNF